MGGIAKGEFNRQATVQRLRKTCYGERAITEDATTSIS